MICWDQQTISVKALTDVCRLKGRGPLAVTRPRADGRLGSEQEVYSQPQGSQDRSVTLGWLILDLKSESQGETRWLPYNIKPPRLQKKSTAHFGKHPEKKYTHLCGR